jgi:glycosyltransferase involved in cell wall biosynthesis
VYYNLIKGKAPEIKSLLDEHNCEYLIMKRHCENAVNPVKKLFLKIEYKKLMRFESKMLQQMDKIIILSEEDNKYLQEITKHEFKSEIIPICIDEHIRKDVTEYDNTVVKMLFLGTMTWEPNRSGLLWFLKNVIPQLKAQGINYSLDIVGKNPGEEIMKLASADKDIHVAGYVEDTEVYFKKCDCMIVPLFVGSGQRVKIIESLSRGFPVISTSVGAEGLAVSDNESILIADTSDEYICALQKLQNNDVYERIAEQSYMAYKKYYSFEGIKKRIAECVRDISF